MPNKQSSKPTISIISFNTLGVPIMSKNLTERYVVLARLIQETDADILAFQEVHTYVHLQILKKLLKQYPYVIYKRFLYGPQGSVVIFSKLPFSSYTFNKFSKRGTFKNSTFYGKFIMNGTLVAKLRDYPTYIFNSYFTTNPNNSWDVNGSFATIQEAQIRDLEKSIKIIRTEGNSAIIVGDFNFIKDSEPYRKFILINKVLDVFANSTIPTYLFGRKSLKFLWKIKFIDRFFVFNAKPSGRVDFIFVLDDNNKIRIQNTDHIFDEKVKLFNGKESYVSDHIGLYAKMEFEI